jgi:hypothetical protein
MDIAAVMLGMMSQSVRAAEGDDDEAETVGGDKAADAAADDVVEAEKVTTRGILPKTQNNRLAAGEWVESLVGFENHPESPSYKVEFIRGSLLSSIDSNYYVQNFTGTLYNRTAHAGETLTFKYKFRPDPNIEPREYGLVIQVFYSNEDNDTFLATPFNQTVVVTDPLSMLDGKTFFAYISILGLAALGGYAVWNTMFKGKKYSAAPAKKAGSTEEEKGTAGIDYAYIPADHRRYAAAKRGETTSRSPVRSPSRKDQ